MIPNADQLQVISQMSRGDLAEIPFPVLLHALAVHRRSVVLLIQRRQLTKEIVLENGIPVDCQSNLLQDTLGKFMVARGDITEEQCQLALSKAATSGQPLADVLVAEGLVNASELFKILQQNLAKKLLDGFTWREGEFQVSTELPRVESPLKVKTPQLVLTGVTKLAPDDEVEQAMAELVTKKLFLNPRPLHPLREIRLSKAHQEIVGLVSLGKTVEELESETEGMPRTTILRLLYSLAVLGIVVPEDRLPQQELVATPDMDFLPMAEAAPEGAAAEKAPLIEDLDRVRNQLMEAYLRYRKQDAFELLGIPDDASREQVDLGYLEFCEHFAPWKFSQPGLESLFEKARDLFIAGGRAFGELCNPETRNSLIARRQSAIGERVNVDARNAFAIKSNLLDSETQFHKGIAAMGNGSYAEALDFLQFSYDCEPQNSRYRAELAYCRYLKDPEIEGERSLEELKETIRIDPESGLALYYAGIILGEAGDFEQAEPWLQRAIKLMKPDRRPIDALKKYKALEKEKPKRRFF